MSLFMNAERVLLVPALIMLVHASLTPGCDKTKDPGPPVVVTLAEPVVSLSVGEEGWVLTRTQLLDPQGQRVPLPPEERGHRLSAAWVDAPGVESEQGALWLGYDRGAVYRSLDGGINWTGLWDGYETPTVPILTLSMRRPVPRQFLRASDGTMYLATAGRAVMRWDAEASVWRDATWALDLDNGGLSPLSFSLAAYDPEGSTPGGGGIAAGYVSPRGLVPPWAVDLFGQQVRTKAGPEAEPAPVETPFQVRFVADLAVRRGRLVMATLGHGVWELDKEGRQWTPLGPHPTPPDLWAMDVSPSGELAVLSRAGDAWVLRKDWVRVRCGGPGGGLAPNAYPGIDLRWVGSRLRVAAGRTIEEFTPREVSCPSRGGARVLLAFSQHLNLYHSYRGDTNTEDGFGMDIRVVRKTIEMFDRHPEFHNDWDVEMLFSLDDWLPTYAPDILEDIARRVEDGQDGIRLMSWNNGLMASQPADEFGLSVDRGLLSLEAFVPGLWTPGVQPQENTFTPAHVELYRAHGIDWITLFYSATSFTAFRQEVPLSLAEAHGLLTLGSDLGPETMTLVPVYHHGDVMDHGGLATWLRKLHENLTGTAVLVIHFDADSETWEGFEDELQDVKALGADWVVPMRLQDIVAELEPVSTVVLQRDLADGAFDGFSSWTEKPVNHRFYTRVVRSRMAAQRATALAAGTMDSEAEASLDAALEARLRTMSTTHFGLANPLLHPEREAAGEAVSAACESHAASALERVLTGNGDLAGATLFGTEGADVAFLMPVDEPLASTGEGHQTPIRSLASADGVRFWLAGALSSDSTALVEPSTPVMTPGSLPLAGWAPHEEALASISVLGPRLRLHGEDHLAETTFAEEVLGEGGRVVTIHGLWPVGTGGQVRYDWIWLEEDPDAWWVEVALTYPTFAEAELPWWEDVVPLELAAPSAAAWQVERPLVTGEVARYPVTEPFDALNAHAADGWLRLLTQDASQGLSVTTFAPMRAAPAFLPVRFALTEDGLLEPRLAPFGALWGELLDHDAASLLGTGVAEFATRLVAPQLQPTALAWNGRSLCMLLRLQPNTTNANLGRLSGARDGLLLVDAQGRSLIREGCL